MIPQVLILIDTYAIGGAGKVILQFLNSGGKDICTPIVAGFWRGPDRPWQFREAVQNLDIRFEVLRQTFAFDPFVIYSALRLVRKNNIQILESHGYKGHTVCLALKQLTGLPWIAFTHGWTHENMKMELYNRIDRSIVRFADRIIPVSKDLGRKLQLGDRAGRNMVVIHNAADRIDSDRSHHNVRTELGVTSDEILVGVVGRLSPEKGHRYLVAAMRLIPTNIPLKVIFIGDGQERERLVVDITNAGLNNRVKLVGFQADVAPFYQACDIVVLPSLAEGLPNAALEAMAFGLPVVASDVGGIPEVVVHGQTGLLVPSCDPNAIAAALVRLIGDRAEMKQFGMAGRQRAERHFNPVERAKKVGDIYRQLLHA